jgi:hypothetical protein
MMGFAFGSGPDGFRLRFNPQTNGPRLRSSTRPRKGRRLDCLSVVGFEASIESADSVRQGRLTAAVAEQPRATGEVAIETLAKPVGGEEVPEFIDTGVVVVTADAVDKQAPAFRSHPRSAPPVRALPRRHRE